MSKSPSLRRIQADIRELALNPSDQYHAAPFENDMFVWHFTIRGADGTDFEGGIYHGRILLPPEYPYKPPHIIFLTPSGRFETNTKICLSFSAFHPELWQPAWGIRLILEALISFLPTPADGALGALDYSPEDRRKLAKQSQSYCCPILGPVAKLLPKLDPARKKSANNNGSSGAYSKEIAELQRLQREREGVKGNTKRTTNSEDAEAEATTVPKENNAEKEAEPKADAGNTEPKEDIEQETVKVLSSDKDEGKNKQDAARTTEASDGASPSSVSNSDGAEGDGSAADTAAISEEDPGSLPAISDNGEENEINDVVDDLSKLYDPLLNLSIWLMLIICVMLWQKWVELTIELNELRETQLAETFMDKSTLSMTSSAPPNEL